MTLAIIDSGGANISSVVHALKRLGADPVFTGDAATIRSADRVLLPGVGAAGAAMTRLKELGLIQCIRELQQPVLGICLGMQLLFAKSKEDDTRCLGYYSRNPAEDETFRGYPRAAYGLEHNHQQKA